MSKTAAIVLAAGSGKRMGGGVKKQFLSLDGKPIIIQALLPFIASQQVDEIVVVAASEDHDTLRGLFAEYGVAPHVKALAMGGQERQDSVFEGLKLLNSDVQWVVVHDGARPLLTQSLLEKCIASAKEKGSAVAAVRVKDTIKVAEADGRVLNTPRRDTLWAVQTPQVFRRNDLLEAHLEAQESLFCGTDDASLMERARLPVYLCEGEYENIKITTPEDLDLARLILDRRKKSCE